MAASKENADNSNESAKSETTKPVPKQTDKPKHAGPTEDLSYGVLRTARLGRVGWTARSGANPHVLEGERHKMLADALKPGDEGYNPHHDPLVPTSTMATNITMELAGSGKSPTWEALHAAEEDAAALYDHNEKFAQERLNRTS